VIAVFGYVYFIEDYGVWAAAGVLGLVYSLRLLLFFVYSQRVLPLPYHYKNISAVLMLGVIMLLIMQTGLGLFVGLENSAVIVLQLLLGVILALVYICSLITFDVLPNPVEWWQGRKKVTV
jgi:hypothetical protein